MSIYRVLYTFAAAYIIFSVLLGQTYAAITYNSSSVSTADSNVVSVGVAYPSSIAEGDLLIMIVGMKPSTANSGSVGAAPESWTAITNGSLTGAGGYGTTLAADTGNTNVFTYYKIADGTESGNELVRLVTNNVSWAQIYRYSNSNGDWSLAATTGSDTSGDASVSIVMSADPGVTTGDHILAAMVIPTDVTTPNQFSAQALTQSGVTFGAVTEIGEPDTGTGNDLGGFVVRSSVSSGTSAGAPTLSGTAGGTVTNVRGPGVFVRIRATGTITYESAGTISISAAVTGICPAHPSSITEGDLLVTVIGMKPSTANSGSVTTPSGWTAITNGSLTGAGGYGTTLAADTGNTNVFTYYRTARGDEATEKCFQISTNNVSWARMSRFSNDSDTWSLAATTGSDTSGDTTVSIAMSADPGVTAGDHILAAMVIPTDVTTPSQFSAQALTQSGVTFDTVTEIGEPDTTTGNDLGGFIVRSSASSGTSAGAPTLSGTAGGTVTNVRGPGVFVRIRETLPTYTQIAYRFFDNANSADVGNALEALSTPASLAVEGDAFRLRMLLRVDTANLHASGQDFKLQFSEKSGTCDTGFTGESYADVTGATVIAYNNNASPADGDNLTANANDPTDGGRTIVNQDYEESNNFTNSVAAIPNGQDGKWDFSLVDNGATAGASYCFRIVKSDGSTLDTYTAIPEITTANSAPVYSVSITSSGVVEYGYVALNTATSTIGTTYTQTATNDGNTSETLNIKSSDASNGVAWTLGTSVGSNQYKHEFSTTSGSIWTTMPDSSTYVTARPSVSQSGTTDFDFRLTTPSATSDYQQKSITITIQAVAP